MQFTHSTKNKLEFRLELESLYGTIKVALLCFAFFHQSSVSLYVCLSLSLSLSSPLPSYEYLLE
jgi:hypothetical protein